MSDTKQRNLVKLGETDLTVGDPAEDIRGRKMLDKSGDDIGKVDGLMLDEDGAKVRFMHVSAGGFLGIGDKTFLIPIDAITKIDEDHVHVDQSKDKIVKGPEYDPSIVRDEGFWESSYGYYGYTPFWTAGYMYPAYPYYGGAGLGGPGRAGTTRR